MYYVYILQSEKAPDQYYYGMTKNIEKRLSEHNRGQSYHTSKYLPWKLKFYGAFETEQLAGNFERYLKTASGKAFLRKRLIEV